jgi:hypothetical protein
VLPYISGQKVFETAGTRVVSGAQWRVEFIAHQLRALRRGGDFMFGKWSQDGVPHKGWQCGEIYDLEDDHMICEMCETAEIRYVHVMSHEQHEGVLRVGCICAGNMEGSLAKVKRREQQLKNTATRRLNWITQKWRTSARGNSFINVKGTNVVVYRKEGGWGGRLENETHIAYLDRSFQTENEVKLAPFDLFAQMNEKT